MWSIIGKVPSLCTFMEPLVGMRYLPQGGKETAPSYLQWVDLYNEELDTKSCEITVQFHENGGFRSIFPSILGFCCFRCTEPRNVHVDLPVQKQILHAARCLAEWISSEDAGSCCHVQLVVST